MWNHDTAIFLWVCVCAISDWRLDPNSEPPFHPEPLVWGVARAGALLPRLVKNSDAFHLVMNV